MKRVTHSYNRLIDRLSRVTTSGRRIRELDGLRFIAIAVVFVQHTYQAALRQYPSDAPPVHDLFAILVRDFDYAVQLFFVISGFILAMPFAAQHMLGGKRVSLKQYYWRRVTRLEPPYLLSLIIWFCVLVFYWGESARALFPHLLASVFYLHNIIYKEFSTINRVNWSLEIEVQFYLIAPFLAYLFLIRRKWLRRTVLVGGILALGQGYRLYARLVPHAPETLVNFLSFFVAGFLLADIYLTDWKQNPRASLWADAIAIPGWLLLPFYFQQQRFLPMHIFPGTTLPLILFGLCWASFRSVLCRKFLASSFIMTVGGMCYSIYLLHLPLLRILSAHSPVPIVGSSLGLNIVAYSVLWGIPILAVSTVYFLFIEKPCMDKNWPKHLRAYWRGERPTAMAGLSSAQSIEALVEVPSGSTAPLPPNQPVP